MLIKSSYVREVYHNYIVIEPENDIMTEEWVLHMLINNTIEGLLKFELRNINGKKNYYYNITSKQPLSRVFEKSTIGELYLRKIMLGIIKVYENLKIYMLSSHDIILEPEYVYANIIDFDVSFFYLQGYNKENSMLEFTEYLMNKVEHTDSEAVMLVYNMYKVVKEENFSIHDISQILDENNNKKQISKGDIETNHISLNTGNENTIPSIEYNQNMHSNFNLEKLKQEELNYVVDGNVPLQVSNYNKKLERENMKYFPIQSYIYSIISIFILLGSIIIGLFGSVCIDYITGTRNIVNTVLVIATGVIICVYTNTKVWRKNNKKEKMTQQEQGIHSLEEKELQNDKIAQGDNNIFNQINIGHDINNPCNYEATVMLSVVKQQCRHYLKSIENNNKIELVTFPFIIGTFKEGVDYQLNNKTISKIHARLELKNNGVYIQDLNSTNGTYINGVQIEDDDLHIVNQNDYIMLGNEEYIYEYK